MKKRPSYTKEFRLEVVQLRERGDKPAADLARELIIRRIQLYENPGQRTIVANIRINRGQARYI